MTMNGHVDESTAKVVAPPRGRSDEELLTCAAYLVLSALFGIGFVCGVASVYVARWIW